MWYHHSAVGPTTYHVALDIPDNYSRTQFIHKVELTQVTQQFLVQS